MTSQIWKIGDCIDLIKELPEKSIDLVIADPPYYKVVDDEWDNQWSSLDEYLRWVESWGLELNRVLKDSGSMYVFGDDFIIAYIQVTLDKHFEFLNHLIWYKRNNIAIKWAHNARRFVSVSERILFYGVKDKNSMQSVYSMHDSFRAIKDYMISEANKLKESKGFKTKEELNQFLNELTGTASVVSRHYFCDSQWVFPTKPLYEKLQTTGFFPIKYEDLKNGFDSDKLEYEGLKDGFEAKRRKFNFRIGDYELLNVPIINNNENTEHNTTKPVKIIEKLIRASSNEGMTVLDPFLGSGTTLQACMNLNRNCIGFEVDPQWEPIYKQRLKHDIKRIDTYF